MRRLALILALVLMLCACAETPPPATTAPPLPSETTQSTETAAALYCPAEETTAPTVSDPYTEWYALLEYTWPETNWLRNAMGCTFETPAQIDLEYLFYGGFGLGSWDLLSTESEQHLIDQGFWREMDIQPMPADQIDQILRSTFGIALSDCTIPDGWAYVEKEDLYCSNHNDIYVTDAFTITDVIESPDGTVEIRYFCEDYYNTATDEFLYSVDLILTLRETVDGFQVISNVLLDLNEYDALYDRELIDILSSEEALALWAAHEDPGSEEGLEYLASLSPRFCRADDAHLRPGHLRLVRPGTAHGAEVRSEDHPERRAPGPADCIRRSALINQNSVAAGRIIT